MSKKRIICSDDEESDEEVQFVEFSGVDKVSSGEMPLPAEELSGINSGNILDSESSRRSRGSSSKKEQMRRDALKQMSSGMNKGLSGLQNSDSGSAYSDSGEDGEGDDDDDDDDNYVPLADDYFKPKKKPRPVSKKLFKDPPPSRKRRNEHYASSSDNEPEPDINDFILNSDEEEEEEQAMLEKAARLRRKERKKRRKRREEKEKEKRLSGGSRSGASSSEKGSAKKKIVLDRDDPDYESPEEEASSEEEDDDNEEGSDSNSNDEEEEEDDEEMDGPLMYYQVNAAMEDDEENDHTLNLRQSFEVPEAIKIYVEFLARVHLDEDFLVKVYKKRKEQKYSRFLAAARQIENKICTVRESLLGSGAWAGGGSEYAHEISERPFYQVTDAPGCWEEDHSEWPRCSACNRASKSLPCLVYCFGTHYDAKRAWSSQEWNEFMPPSTFLYEESWYAAAMGRQKKKSNDDDGDDDDDDDDSVIQPTKEPVTNNSSSKDKKSSSSKSKKVIVLDDDDDDDSDIDENRKNDEEDDEEDEEETAPQVLQWWQRKWPPQLMEGKESKWFLSGHCKGRTQLYHTLLHYKFRLLMKIKEKLQAVHGNIAEFLSNNTFVKSEVSRYQTLLDLTSKLFGGKSMDESAERKILSIWRDRVEEGHGGDGKMNSSSSSSTEGGAPVFQASMLNWLSANKQNELELKDD